MQKSHEFNSPLIPIVEEKHGGVLGKTGTFIHVKPENIIVECVKKAEDNQNLVFRLYEYAGLKTEVEALLNLNKTLREACKTNILEDEVLEEIEVEENKLKFSLKPYEISTIKIVLS